MERGFERVYTVTDYYDGPRGGVADFRGAPHVYRSIYLDAATWNGDEDRFELSPISPDVLALALEDWAIWQRFDRARQAGEITTPAGDTRSWGALAADAPRRAELERRLRGALAIDPARRLVARGAFRPREPVLDLPVDVIRPLEVQWSLVE